MSPVLELADVVVRPGTQAQFERAFEQARRIVAQAHGFRGLQLWHSVERPDVYRLLISWETLEDHTEGFRGSELFVQWRGLIGEYFAQPPSVEHGTLVVEAGEAPVGATSAT